MPRTHNRKAMRDGRGPAAEGVSPKISFTQLNTTLFVSISGSHTFGFPEPAAARITASDNSRKCKWAFPNPNRGPDQDMTCLTNKRIDL